MSAVVKAYVPSLARIAVVSKGEYRYGDIMSAALQVVKRLPHAPSHHNDTPPFPPNAAGQARIAVMCDPGPEYMSATMAAWLSRGIAVPLCLTHPDRELEYVLADAGIAAVLASGDHLERITPLAGNLEIPVCEVACNAFGATPTTLNVQAPLASLGALIIYTSGTTGRPKGVLHTFSSLDAQIGTLCTTWEWSSDDRILHCLPLHHIHGIVNALYCAHASGAAVEFLPKFSPTEVWARLCRESSPITVFMGVPTMFSFLLNVYDAASPTEQRTMKAAAQRLRLVVSGSAACPTPILARWQALAGYVPLERYGMTETGMILGNPLHGTRYPGTVGVPFQGMETRVDPATGELGVRGGQLFAGYWGRPDATAAALDHDGFFLTGDTASIDPESGYYKLLGRTSVDIIKNGGYKISALDIESVLLENPAVQECAVLGIPDVDYGEQVAAIVALKSGQTLELAELQEWCRQRLPPYQIPKSLRVVDKLTRNAMGKVNKKSLRADVFPEHFPAATAT